MDSLEAEMFRFGGASLESRFNALEEELKNEVRRWLNQRSQDNKREIEVIANHAHRNFDYWNVGFTLSQLTSMIKVQSRLLDRLLEVGGLEKWLPSEADVALLNDWKELKKSLNQK